MELSEKLFYHIQIIFRNRNHISFNDNVSIAELFYFIFIDDICPVRLHEGRFRKFAQDFFDGRSGFVNFVICVKQKIIAVRFYIIDFCLVQLHAILTIFYIYKRFPFRKIGRLPNCDFHRCNQITVFERFRKIRIRRSGDSLPNDFLIFISREIDKRNLIFFLDFQAERNSILLIFSKIDVKNGKRNTTRSAL